VINKLAAEAIGTFWLVLGGCGSAVLAAAFPQVGIGLHGVSLAFGLTVLTMAFAIGHISGCHLNPAVSVGLWAGGRFAGKDLLPYIVAQVAGGIAAGAVLYVIASGAPGFDVTKGFASNGYGAHSPGGYSLTAALLTEVVMTAFFLVIILGATDRRAPAGFAPIAIGLALTLIHLISIRSRTPRSTRPAAPAWPCSPAAGQCSSCGCSGSRPSSARCWAPACTASLAQKRHGKAAARAAMQLGRSICAHEPRRPRALATGRSPACSASATAATAAPDRPTCSR